MGICSSNDSQTTTSKRDSGERSTTQNGDHDADTPTATMDPGEPRFSTSETRKSLRGSYVVEKDGTKTYVGFYSPRLGGIVGGEGTSSNGRAYKGHRHGSEASRSHSQSTVTAQNYSFGTSYTTSSQAARGSAQLANTSFGTQYSLEEERRNSSHHQHQQDLYRKMKMLASCGGSNNPRGGGGKESSNAPVYDCASNASRKSILPLEPEGVEEAWSEAMRRSSFEGRGSAPQTAENIPLNPEFESINDSIARFRDVKRNSEKYLLLGGGAGGSGLSSSPLLSGSGAGGNSPQHLPPIPSPSQPTRPPSPQNYPTNVVVNGGVQKGEGGSYLPNQVPQEENSSGPNGEKIVVVKRTTAAPAGINANSPPDSNNHHATNDSNNCDDIHHGEGGGPAVVQYMTVSVSPNEHRGILEEAKKGWFMTPQSIQGHLTNCSGSQEGDSPGTNRTDSDGQQRRSSSAASAAGNNEQQHNNINNNSNDGSSRSKEIHHRQAENQYDEVVENNSDHHHRAIVPEGIAVPALNMGAVEVSNQERAREKARREQLLKQQKHQQQLQKQGHILKTKHMS